MLAYVQQGQQGDPNYVNLEQIAYGFWERGYEVIRFDYPELREGRLDRGLIRFPEETILAGGVGTVREALVRAGRPLPPMFDLPADLEQWIGREYWMGTLAEIRALVDSESELLPLHVKPRHHHKRFTGTIVSQFRDLIPSADVEGNFPVIVQNVVQFVSEWRASILRDEIIHVAHYRGDPLLFPDPHRMRAALEAFADRPIAFAMDWGVTEAAETLLVEVNDGFALGNYGVARSQYTAIIESRWRQLMGLGDNLVGVKW